MGEVGGELGGKMGKVGEWCGWKVGGSWFCARVGNAGGLQDFIFWFLMLMKGKKRRVGFKIFLCGCRNGKTLL